MTNTEIMIWVVNPIIVVTVCSIGGIVYAKIIARAARRRAAGSTPFGPAGRSV